MTDNQKLLCTLFGETDAYDADRAHAQMTPLEVMTVLIAFRPGHLVGAV
jgi:hypothetical protein